MICVCRIVKLSSGRHDSFSNNESLEATNRRVFSIRLDRAKGKEQVFRKGRGPTGMFRFRKLVKKKMWMQEKVAVDFVDMANAYNTRSREKHLQQPREMGVPHVEAREVTTMYE